ncbi:MAG: hypothetical protein H7Z41_05565 [Cytophagales bacterium]|nr:hypothetical protein [Armatimonadota bacterium]
MATRELSEILDDLEMSGASATGDLFDTYQGVRPHLRDLTSALSLKGGDYQRIGTVIENLLAGADSLATTGGPGEPTSDSAAANRI